MNKHQHQGFTLIELLVALFIAGLLITAGVPRLTTVFSAFSASSSAEELVSALTFARGQAIFRQEAVSVCSGTNNCSGSNTWTGGWIVFVDGNGDNNYSASEPTDELLKVVEVSHGDIEVTHNSDIITFDRLGENVAAAASQFNLCSDSGGSAIRKTVEVTLVGYTSTKTGAVC